MSTTRSVRVQTPKTPESVKRFINDPVGAFHRYYSQFLPANDTLLTAMPPAAPSYEEAAKDIVLSVVQTALDKGLFVTQKHENRVVIAPVTPKAAPTYQRFQAAKRKLYKKLAYCVRKELEQHNAMTKPAMVDDMAQVAIYFHKMSVAGLPKSQEKNSPTSKHTKFCKEVMTMRATRKRATAYPVPPI